MKKRSIIIASVVALLIVLVIGGTMAWFTSNPAKVDNIFTAGTVDIELLENNEVIESGKLIFDNVNPGDTWAKKVEVKSLGSKDTYVRVKFDVLWEDVEGDVPDGDFDPEELNVAEIDFNNTNWIYKDGYYYYSKIVKGTTEPGGVLLEPLFNTVKFKGREMGNEYQGSKLTITLKAEAVQASNYAFRDAWEIIGDDPEGRPTVPAPGVELWTGPEVKQPVVVEPAN